MKFKTKPHVVEAFRITDDSVAGPEGVGSWFVQDGGKQYIVSNEEFLSAYTPAGRGAAREAFIAAGGKVRETKKRGAGKPSAAPV